MRQNQHKELSSREELLWPADRETSPRLSNSNNPELKGMGLLQSKCPEGMVVREKATLPQQTKLPRAPEYLRVSVQWAAYVLKEVRKPLPG